MRDAREPLANLTVDDLKALIREQVLLAFETLRPSSVLMTQNAKHERTIEVKEYASDTARAYDMVARQFDKGVRELHTLGTDASPYKPVILTGTGREERS